MSSSVRSPFRIASIALFLTGFVITLTVLLLTPKNPIQAFSTASITLPRVRQSLPARIQIASLIDLPIKEMPFGPDGWEVSMNSASIATTSARSGESGNIIIYSHNLQRLFGHLSQVKVGDIVTLTSSEGSIHRYTVTSRAVVSPDRIDALMPTKTEVLTLYTCSGLFDSQRLVVQAVPTL